MDKKLTRSAIGMFLAFNLSAGLNIANAAPPQAAQICAGCHGAKGEGIPPLGPSLAGSSAEYIAKQIHLFKDGSRKNAQMQGMVMMLNTEEKVQEVADYYGSQKGSPLKIVNRGTHAVIKDPAARMANQGAWERDIPACNACHGPSGVGYGRFPRLAGQQEQYLKDQLMAWRVGERTGDHDNAMGSIPPRMTVSEINAIAKYYAELK